jgi:hypothetical protein
MKALEGAQMLNKKLRAALPPPIKPLANKAPKPHKFDTAVKGPVDWEYWRHIETVELWQALLLSLNITPPGNGWLLDNASGQTGDIPYAYLDAHGLTDKFTSRCRLLRNRLETLYAGRGAARNVELTDFIGLPLFAAWAAEFEWDLLPQELLILANQWNTKRINLQSESDNQGKRTELPAVPKDDAASKLDAPIELIVKTSTPDATPTSTNKWDEHNLRRLLTESREPGVTQLQLAVSYGVTRQRIAKLLKKADDQFSTKRSAISVFANPMRKK